MGYIFNGAVRRCLDALALDMRLTSWRARYTVQDQDPVRVTCRRCNLCARETIVYKNAVIATALRCLPQEKRK
jgi:hypothetical protein